MPHVESMPPYEPEREPDKELSIVEERFLEAIRHHFRGWHAKVDTDFSESAFQNELDALTGDEVYAAFGFANPAYVLTRLVGRMSISIGRRLGEIYDKIPQIATGARFGLDSNDVVIKVRGKLLLDIHIPFAKLSSNDKDHAVNVLQRHAKVDLTNVQGIGIEVRYNFNPNDSARLRKDKEMAGYLIEDGLVPVYLVFSSISPRDEAIASLRRAGWRFLIGDAAIQFMKDLVEMDFHAILSKPKVKAEVAKEVEAMMGNMLRSAAFQRAVEGVYDLRDTDSEDITPA